MKLFCIKVPLVVWDPIKGTLGCKCMWAGSWKVYSTKALSPWAYCQSQSVNYFVCKYNLENFDILDVIKLGKMTPHVAVAAFYLTCLNVFWTVWTEENSPNGNFAPKHSLIKRAKLVDLGAKELSPKEIKVPICRFSPKCDHDKKILWCWQSSRYVAVNLEQLP